MEEHKSGSARRRRLRARTTAVHSQIDRLIAAILTEKHLAIGAVLADAGIPFTLVGMYVALTVLDEAQLEPGLQTTLTEVVFQAVVVAMRHGVWAPTPLGPAVIGLTCSAREGGATGVRSVGTPWSCGSGWR